MILGLKSKKRPVRCSRFGDKNSCWSYLSRVSWLRKTPLRVNRGWRNHIWRRERTCVCKKQEEDFTEYGFEDGIVISLWTHVNVCNKSARRLCEEFPVTWLSICMCVCVWNTMFEDYVSLKHMHEEPCVHKWVSLYVWCTYNFDLS